MTERVTVRTMLAGFCLCLTMAASQGCSVAMLATAQPDTWREQSATISVHGEAMTLHLATPIVPPSAATPLVLYASGDGGWFGAAVGMFRTLAASGVPVAGFSTKTLMNIERRWSKPLTVAHIAEGYQQIAEAARAKLQMSPDAPVVLTGWSRGASLAVLVAGSRDVDPHVAGIVAIGLAAEERLEVESETDDDSPSVVAASAGDRHMRTIALYPLIARIAPRRTVVVQASGDGYLPAAQARQLFGPDSASGRLVAIDARNHRFSGGELAFSTALVEGVRWVSALNEGSR